MANDYIPADDAGLRNFASNLVAKVTATPVAYGLVAGDATALGDLFDSFDASVVQNTTKQNDARVARATKDAARSDLVKAIRSIAARVQAFPSTTDSARIELGLTVKDTTPTAVSAPNSQPVLFVDTSKRLEHTISFRDALTPLSTAKPAGVLGCEIYLKIVDPRATPAQTPPASIDECQFLGTDTASPFTVPFSSADAGKTAYYFARWATRTGLTGPTSDLISATIVA